MRILNIYYNFGNRNIRKICAYPGFMKGKGEKNKEQIVGRKKKMTKKKRLGEENTMNPAIS